MPDWLNQETVAIIVGFVINAVVQWRKANTDRDKVEAKVEAAGAQATAPLVEEAEKLRQQLTATTLQRDMYQSMIRYAKRDPAAAAVLQRFADRRRASIYRPDQLDEHDPTEEL